MADVKVVSGTLGGAKVTTSQENAERLGSVFEPAKAPAKKAAAKKSA